jgi:hypothetical protein
MRPTRCISPLIRPLIPAMYLETHVAVYLCGRVTLTQSQFFNAT